MEEVTTVGTPNPHSSIAPFSPASPHLEHLLDGALDVYVAVFGGGREEAREFVTRYTTTYPHFSGRRCWVRDQGEMPALPSVGRVARGLSQPARE